MPFAFKPTAIPDVVLIEPRVFPDARGWFMETYKRSDFERAGIVGEFCQDNQSRTVGRGALRGLHYQKAPHEQGKLVRCTEGEVFDVAVDIRRRSPTYGRWVGATLSAQNKAMIWIPPGFAHGFCTMSDVAELHYRVTGEYSLAAERGIRWDDPDLAIAWPVENPTMAEKDLKHPRLKDADNDF